MDDFFEMEEFIAMESKFIKALKNTCKLILGALVVVPLGIALFVFMFALFGSLVFVFAILAAVLAAMALILLGLYAAKVAIANIGLNDTRRRALWGYMLAQFGEAAIPTLHICKDLGISPWRISLVTVSEEKVKAKSNLLLE